MNETTANLLVACAGERVGGACREAIEAITADQCESYQFIMSEWLDTDQFNRAVLLWIVDDSAPWDTVHRALANHIPLLVPQDNIAMSQLCMSAACGLTYRDGAEAIEILELLLTDEKNRSRMAANGHAYVNGYDSNMSGPAN